MSIIASTKSRTAAKTKVLQEDVEAAVELLSDGQPVTDGEVYPAYKNESRAGYNAYLAGWTLRQAVVEAGAFDKKALTIRTYQEDDGGYTFSIFVK